MILTKLSFTAALLVSKLSLFCKVAVCLVSVTWHVFTIYIKEGMTRSQVHTGIRMSSALNGRCYSLPRFIHHETFCIKHFYS